MERAEDPDTAQPEPEPGAAAAEDAAGRPAAPGAADLRCAGTATATVPAAGPDLGSLHHTPAPDTASAAAAAAAAERWFAAAPSPTGFTATASSKTRPTIQIFWEE